MMKDRYDKLWEIAGEKGRSEAMYACTRLGISRRSAYEELYGESIYDLEHDDNAEEEE